MPELLYLTNFPEVNIVEKTLLDAALSAGATSSTVKNAKNFAINDFVVFGRVETEQAEKVQLNAASATTQVLGFPATLFAHAKLEDVVKLRGDAVRVYRAANADDNQPDDDSFVLIKTATINVKRSYTEYNDPDGGIGYWYKITYYNSTSGDETDISESPAVRGGNFGHYATVEQVRKAAGFVGNSDISDEAIAEARDEAEGTVKGYIIAAAYELPISEPYPASLSRLVKQLASAFLLQDEYGSSTQGTDLDGYAKEKAVLARLDAIQEGTYQLIDVNKEVVIPKKDDVSGWPDDSTINSQLHGRGPKFTMSGKF